MNRIWIAAGLGLLSYLIGAIPCGWLIARAHGVDIRRAGSGNIGATNVFRSVSKPAGILTFVLDGVKGFVPAFLFPLAAAHWVTPVEEEALKVLCGCLAVAGHNWPVYLGFKGGKGISTSTGALLGIAPQAVLVGFVSWVLALVLTRYVSVASMFAAVATASAAWAFWLHQPRSTLVVPCALTVLAAVALMRHRDNFHRLMDGTEHRFTFRRKT